MNTVMTVIMAPFFVTIDEVKHGPPGGAHDEAQYLAGWMLLFCVVVLGVINLRDT